MHDVACVADADVLSLPYPGQQPERRTARVALLLGILAAGLFAWGGVDFCLDDAWIHLSYAKSLRLGDGLSYNPGDWETGFSSPLWALLLAVWPTGTAPVMSVPTFVAKNASSFHGSR